MTQKRGGKRAKQVFQKHTNSASKTCWEKDRREKGRKNVFYIQTNNVTNKRGGKRAKQIFRNTQIERSKMFGKNRRKKGRKNVFYFQTNIITKTAGKKTLETIFSETHE